MRRYCHHCGRVLSVDGCERCDMPKDPDKYVRVVTTYDNEVCVWLIEVYEGLRCWMSEYAYNIEQANHFNDQAEQMKRELALPR